MTNLACTYVKVGRYKEAIALHEQVVEKFRALPEDHPFKGTNHASNILSKIYRVRFNTFSSADAIYNLGCAYGRVHRFQEALHLLENSFEMRQRLLPADHSDLGNEICLINSTQSFVTRHRVFPQLNP